MPKIYPVPSKGHKLYIVISQSNIPYCREINIFDHKRDAERYAKAISTSDNPAWVFIPQSVVK